MAVIERVKHIHSFVNGTRPDGVPYRALDPELIAWVHTCIPWMILRAYEATNQAAVATGEGSLSRRAGGHRQDWAAPTGYPRRQAELEDYVESMRARLSVNAQTREFIDFLMTSPFFPDLPDRIDRQLHRFAIYAGMSLAPRWAQELIGYDRPPMLTRALTAPVLRMDAHRVRWAFGAPRYRLMAQRRAAGVTQPTVVAS